MHRQHARLAKGVDFAACQIHVQSKQGDADVQKLRDVTEELLKDATDATKAEVLGLPRPMPLPLDPEIIKMRVEETYARIF